MLKEIPGIAPARMYEGCTRNAYHLYMFRYDKTAVSPDFRARRSSRRWRRRASRASGGYSPLNTQPFLKNTLHSRGYQRLFSAAEIAAWEERNRCPANDRLCEEAVWFVQTMLLAPRKSMEQIAEAVRKIQQHAANWRRRDASTPRAGSSSPSRCPRWRRRRTTPPAASQRGLRRRPSRRSRIRMRRDARALLALGHTVTIVYLTRGEAGVPGKSHDEAAAIRTAECEASCKILGAKPIFAGQIDGATVVDAQGGGIARRG